MRALKESAARAAAMAVALLSCGSPATAFLGPQVGNGLQVGGVRNFAPPSTSRLSMVAEKRVENVAAILLAGGVGKRMEAKLPKQFLKLSEDTVLEHNLKLFLSLKGISQIVLVLDGRYRDMLADLAEREPRLVFADPGTERQDSVYNALQKVNDEAALVCIHDTARPLVTRDSVYQVIADADEHGAAVLGVLMKATVKESEDGEFVQRTIDRTRLWDIQTPQVVKPDILRKGFDRLKSDGWKVTDDVSIVEQLDLPVKITKGEYTNVKITTPEDLVVASQILESRRTEEAESGSGGPYTEEPEERFSLTRANEKWSDTPRGHPGKTDQEKPVSFSSSRADETWADKPVGIPPKQDAEVDIKVDFSKMRADE